MFGLAISQDTWEGDIFSVMTKTHPSCSPYSSSVAQKAFMKHHFNPTIGPYGSWVYKPQQTPLSTPSKTWELNWFDDWYGKYEELGAMGK